MTGFLVASIAWACPGGWFSGFIPQNVKPLICKTQTQVEGYDRLSRAQDRVRELGVESAPSISEIKGLRIKTLPVSWITSAKF